MFSTFADGPAAVLTFAILAFVALLVFAANRKDARAKREAFKTAIMAELDRRATIGSIRRPGFGPPPPAFTHGQRRKWGD